MQGCPDPYNIYGFWAFVLVAVLSHARGTALLLRAGVGVILKWRVQRLRMKRRHY